MRQGVGKIRHLSTQQLWIQENVKEGDFVINKIPRSENISDALTHPWASSDLPFWNQMGLRFIP